MIQTLILLVVAAAPAEPHPIQVLLNLTQQRLVSFERTVQTYQCIVQRQERVHGTLQPRTTTFLRVRQKPFAVYLKMLDPPDLAGREALYNPDKYGENVIVRNGGKRFAFITLIVASDSDVISKETNYKVADWGVAQTLRTVIEILEQEREQPDLDVTYYDSVKVDGQFAFGARIKHKEKRPGVLFYEALVLIDSRLRLPVYYKALDWPDEDGKTPVLEEFSFSKWEFNAPLTEQHFSHKHPDYGFDKTKEFSDGPVPTR